MSEDKQPLHARLWYEGNGKSAFMYRSWSEGHGLPCDICVGSPVIGICNTVSRITPCNAHLSCVVEKVKCGAREADGVAFPVGSFSEGQTRPMARRHGNLAAIMVEEPVRACPVDGVVLMAGRDRKNTYSMMGTADMGNTGLLRKPLEKGVRDMIRFSDTRMSGAACGAGILHVAPDAAESGTAVCVRSGDRNEANVADHGLHPGVGDEAPARRAAGFGPASPQGACGYRRTCPDHAELATPAGNFDLAGGSGELSPQRVSQ